MGSRARRGILALALCVTGSCRDVGRISEVAPFEWPDGSPRLLTYNVGNDQNATWSAAGDSVYYSAAGYPGVPLAPGVLLVAPHTGGTVRPVFAFLHSGQVSEAHHVAPTISPDGRRIAFFDIVREAAEVECDAPSTEGSSCPGSQPRLERAQLVVRDVNEASSEAAALDVVLPGRGQRVFPPFEENAYPYHELYARDGRIVFTIAWAPDGERVAFSDGVGLYVWTPGTDTPVRLPNIEYALHPTWSPDGEWLAFMQLAPTASASIGCTCADGAVVVRTYHETDPAMLAVVRPDGSGMRMLGAGQDPSFAPDGTLYAHVAGRIARVDTDTGAATPVPGTDDGYEPALSPDGRMLAFTRRPDSGGSDVWVVELDTP